MLRVSSARVFKFDRHGCILTKANKTLEKNLRQLPKLCHMCSAQHQLQIQECPGKGEGKQFCLVYL